MYLAHPLRHTNGLDCDKCVRRKRDIWEGGHRVPGVIAWPAVVGPVARESWETVITSDFLPTIMDILHVKRPLPQAHWEMDGVSILPILLGQPAPKRCIGHNFNTEGGIDRALRCGKWKLVQYPLRWIIISIVKVNQQITSFKVLN
jgi:arylsulfatase A-like enzyme